ncbi:MAG: type I glyceraldehyde-3-phosphate dehydrogenase [Actinomycetia bacterium]|nr:type I glyceraldehyde-3-phosphate dehydrogenase [Actinomycetes bacterium]MCQ3803853.1 type I glyceraldehyde-3-phosphate dehydrogenase [Acidimicrobiia bacterium]MCY4650396.1 type I glyceraldehyde-3-phosphate dehydrogenase [bacterium]
MKFKVAINGFGRIGRSVLRILIERDLPDLEVVAVNDLADDDVLAYLLRYDSVMGPLEEKVTLSDGVMEVRGYQIHMLCERDPSKLPWDELGVDVVVESTGVFRTRAALTKHLEAGAGRVVLTVPPKDPLDLTVVLGVNDHLLGPDATLISNASCTTNCLAPVAKILNDHYRIERGLMTTVHAYTNDQRLADVPHADLRRSRAATENIIPTTTGAARAVGKVLPELEGKLDGMAMRVPVADGSIVDLVVELSEEVTAQQVNEAVRAEAAGRFAGIVQYTEAPVVSSDIIGNPHSSVFDAGGTAVLGANLVKVLAWYDNEWGYSNRVVDLIERLGQLTV